MSKRRPRSDNPARRVIRINPPSQIASNSSRDISEGREAPGACTSTSSSLALATTMKRPSRNVAIAGNGILASRDHLVLAARAFNPKILGAPENLRCANLVCSEPMADLLAIRRNTLEMQ